MKKDLDDRAPWRLAGGGWNAELTALLSELRKEQNLMNTPKTPQINALFDTYLGLSSLSSNWRWPGMTAARAAKKLDDFVSLRGDIAHRGQASKAVTKMQAEEFAGLVECLVEKTDEAVLTYMKPMMPRGRKRKRKRTRR